MADDVAAQFRREVIQTDKAPDAAAAPGWLCLPVSEWLRRDIPAPDFLLGEWLTTTSRAMLVAPTGLGKTNFAMALGFAMAAGTDFLHWRARRAARVLYIDGEMSRRLLKIRLSDAVRRLGSAPDAFFALCRDDVEEMPPLNTFQGQAFIDRVVEALGGVDFIVFDNVMSLLAGDMKDEESWQQTLPWVKGLTKRSIGQLWVHHTGHNETHSYGSKTREWMLDTVILLERTERPGTDIAFSLTFTKSRERAPHNRADFEPTVITLAEDQWFSEAAPAKAPAKKQPGSKLPAAAQNALDALHKAVEAAGQIPPGSNHIPAGRRAVRTDLWRRYCDEGSVSGSDKADSRLKAFKRAADILQARREIGVWEGWAWLAK